MSRLTIGGVLAVALLGLFVYAVVVALQLASNCASPPCVLSDSITFLLQTIGALVSAVVVSELAVTRPTETPGTLRATSYSDNEKKAVKILTSLYILVWLISGLFIVVLGWVRNTTVPQLVSVAKEWIGFAIGAAYAYFGISPEDHETHGH
jgi:hypothetical protein